MRIDVPVELAAGDRRQVAEEVLRVRERRRRRRFDARHRVVLVAHHDAAPRREVVADVVVPGVVVAVAVAHHDERQLSEVRDVGREVDVLAEERPAVVEHLGHRQRTGHAGGIADVETRLLRESVDHVAAVEHAVAIHVEHDVVGDTQTETRVAVEQRRVEERVGADAADADRQRLRRAENVRQHGIHRVDLGRAMEDDVRIDRLAEQIVEARRIEADEDRVAGEQHVGVVEPREARELAAGELRAAHLRELRHRRRRRSRIDDRLCLERGNRQASGCGDQRDAHERAARGEEGGRHALQHNRHARGSGARAGCPSGRSRPFRRRPRASLAPSSALSECRRRARSRPGARALLAARRGARLRRSDPSPTGTPRAGTRAAAPA